MVFYHSNRKVIKTGVLSSLHSEVNLAETEVRISVALTQIIWLCDVTDRYNVIYNSKFCVFLSLCESVCVCVSVCVSPVSYTHLTLPTSDLV